MPSRRVDAYDAHDAHPTNVTTQEHTPPRNEEVVNMAKDHRIHPIHQAEGETVAG